MAVAPIWKDHYVTLGTGDVMQYRIRIQDQAGEIIYNGTSHKKPGSTENYIRINDICADYLTNALPFSLESSFNLLAIFTVDEARIENS